MTSTATLEFPAEVQLPFELRDDEHQYEIVDGNRLEKPAMSTISTRLSFLIAHYLELFVSANRLGRAFMEQIFWLNKSRDDRDRRVMDNVLTSEYGDRQAKIKLPKRQRIERAGFRQCVLKRFDGIFWVWRSVLDLDRAKNIPSNERA